MVHEKTRIHFEVRECVGGCRCVWGEGEMCVCGGRGKCVCVWGGGNVCVCGGGGDNDWHQHSQAFTNLCPADIPNILPLKFQLLSILSCRVSLGLVSKEHKKGHALKRHVTHKRYS